MINEAFECENCSKPVSPHPSWSARNHCPFCLYSKHLDKEFPWDRESECHWLMEPSDIDYKWKKWYMILHKCKKCRKTIPNKLSPDDKFLEYIQSSSK